jgi:hypothetical protein
MCTCVTLCLQYAYIFCKKPEQALKNYSSEVLLLSLFLYPFCLYPLSFILFPFSFFLTPSV